MSQEADDAIPKCPGACAARSGLPPEGEAEVPASVCRVIDELRVLYRIASILQHDEGLDAILRDVLDALTSSLDFYSSSLHILNRATEKIEVEVFSGLQLELIGPDITQADATLRRKAIETGAAHVMAIRQKDSVESPATQLAQVPESKFPSARAILLSVPISHPSGTLGALNLACRGSPRHIVAKNLQLLSTVGQLLAHAVYVRQRAAEQIASLRMENERLQEQMQRQFRPANLIGNSRAMQTVYLSIEQVASSQTTVLIRGESGTGKELVAHAIHAGSPRKDRPYVKVNCAALPESIVESELFGHEKGAFTGAIAMRKGRFEIAHRGTIFLDEIGELPMATQAKLLRILQEREFERVGGTETLRCDVRVIAATHRPLEELVERGAFRQDLYYRLNVFPIYLPPLRERKADILQLADFFVEKYNKLNSRNVTRISTPAIEMLLAYSWPGNVRELENVIERATLLTTDGVIHGHHLPPTLQMPEAGPPGDKRPTLQAALDAFEREMIFEALKAHRGNMAAAARQLGVTERIMALRVKKFGINPAALRG